MGPGDLPKDLQLERPWQRPSACGPDALYYLLRLNGRRVERDELIEQLNPPREGCSLEDLRRAALRASLSAFVLKVGRDDFGRLRMPFVAHLEGEGNAGHFAVVIGGTRSGDLRLIDGNEARIRTVDREKFFRNWTGYALVVHTDRPERVLDLVIAAEVALLGVLFYWRGRAAFARRAVSPSIAGGATHHG